MKTSHRGHDPNLDPRVDVRIGNRVVKAFRNEITEAVEVAVRYTIELLRHPEQSESTLKAATAAVAKDPRFYGVDRAKMERYVVDAHRAISAWQAERSST